MATAKAQKKWRDKNQFVKRQLNVMARKLVHDDLDEIAEIFALNGKGEAVSFSCFVTRALMQHGEFNDEAARLLAMFGDNFQRDRDAYGTAKRGGGAIEIAKPGRESSTPQAATQNWTDFLDD